MHFDLVYDLSVKIIILSMWIYAEEDAQGLG